MKKKFVAVLVIILLSFVLFAEDKAKTEKESKPEKKSGESWFGEPEKATIELGVGFFFHKFYFETEDNDTGNAGHIYFVKDLGMDKKDLHFTANFALRLKSIKLSVGYTMLDAKKTDILKRNIVFFDAVFGTGDKVKTKFNMHLITLDFCWYILDLDLGKNFSFRLGPSIRIDGFITDIKVDDTFSNRGDKFDIPIVPFPSIGLSFETTLFKYSGIFFDINGMYAGKYLGYINLKSGVRVYPWHWTGLEFSYRHIIAKAEWKGDLVKANFQGFNMELVLRF